jgi:quercetin dioxygenase-like cupin family protein
MTKIVVAGSGSKIVLVAGGLVFLAMGVLTQFGAPLQAEQQKEVTVTPVLSTAVTSAGQPIVLPQNEAQLVVSLYDVAPHVALPEHKHPYPRYGYVLAGNLRVTDSETGQSATYKPGDFILESVGQWHVGANIGETPTKLLVIDIVEKGQTNTVLRR